MQSESSRVPLWFLYYYRQTGLLALEPIYMLKWKLPYSDTPIFFSRSFILPDAYQQHFSQGNAIGKIMGENCAYIYVDENKAAKQILGGSTIGKNSLSLHANLIQAVHTFQNVNAIILSSNEVWMRTLVRRIDGSVVVLLNRLYVINDCPNLFVVEFQDVTKQFLHYL